MSWSSPQLLETTHQERALQEGEKAHRAFVLRSQGQEDGEGASHLGSPPSLLLSHGPFLYLSAYQGF